MVKVFFCSCVILVMVLLSFFIFFFSSHGIFFVLQSCMAEHSVIGSDCVNLDQFNIIANITLHDATVQYFAKCDPRNPYC
jgi:hypothetical protein